MFGFNALAVIHHPVFVLRSVSEAVGGGFPRLQKKEGTKFVRTLEAVGLIRYLKRTMSCYFTENIWFKGPISIVASVAKLT